MTKQVMSPSYFDFNTLFLTTNAWLIFRMAEAATGDKVNEVDDGEMVRENGISDQVIDPWCEPCLDETRVKVDAVGYCPECNSHLCLSCQEFHKKWPTLQNHRLLRGSRMPKSHADKPIKYPSCSSHAGNLTDHYCPHHSIMVCNDCIKTDHQSCEALQIPDVCKKMDSEDVKRFKGVANDIKQNVSITKATLQKNISDIESQKKAMTKRAESEREKLISKANDLFEETVSNINATCNKTTSDITEHIEILSDETHQLDEIIDTIDKKTIADIDANIFVQIQNIVASTKECKQEIEDTIHQLHVTELVFALNEKVVRINDEVNLGSIKEILKPVGKMKDVPDVAFPQPKEKKHRNVVDVSKIRAKKTSIFNIKTAEDTKTCGIYSMAITGNDTLIIADGPNKTVKFFRPDNTLLTTFKVSEIVQGLEVIGDSEAVVSTTGNKIHFLDISALPSVALRKSISLTYTATRFNICSDSIIVACQRTNPASLKRIDRNGEEIWSIPTELDNQQLFEKPYGVQMITFNGTKAVMVTDWGKKTLTVVDASNAAVLNITDLKDKSSCGLTVDDVGNIFICCTLTREILVLSKDLSQCQVLLKGQDIQMNPLNVLYKKLTGELYVTYDNADEIERFQLSVTNE